ncbi:unnamed protein product, partial [marine sediment metagenome]
MAVVKINGTKFGEITINGKPHDSDMTVYWNGKMSYRTKEHTIELGEFIELLKAGTEIVIIGTGQVGVVKIMPEVVQWAEDKKVAIYTEKTPKAAEIFNA